MQPFCQVGFCIDEGPKRNDFYCTKCNKLVGRFILDNEHIANLRKESRVVCAVDNEGFNRNLSASLEASLGQMNKNLVTAVNNQVYSDMKELFAKTSFPDALFQFDSGLLPLDFELSGLYLQEHAKKLETYVTRNILFAILAVLVVILILVVAGNIYIWVAFNIGKSQLTYRLSCNFFKLSMASDCWI